jgi:hypothetical protein
VGYLSCSCVFRGALHFFNKIFLLIKNKKIKKKSETRQE